MKKWRGQLTSAIAFILIACMLVPDFAVTAAATGIDSQSADMSVSVTDFQGGAMGMSGMVEEHEASAMSAADDATAFGIDVSSYQGKIDWKTVSKNIDFAILRCGYGSNSTKQDDTYFKTNADACTNLGIPFGVYLYSYATTDAKALSEAKHVLRLIEGYDLQLPVYLDLEDQLLLDKCSKADILRHAKIFCDTIEAAGYEVGVYANYYWWTTFLTSSEYDKWDRWVARYGNSPLYTKEFSAWQYTASGKLDGIVGKVDMNYWYGPFPHDHEYKSSISGEATCENPGTRVFTCKCGDNYTESIPATGHTYTNTVVPATCTEPGYVAYHCDACDDSYREIDSAALGHSFKNDICSRCGSTYDAAENDDPEIDEPVEEIFVPDAPKVKISNVASSGKIQLNWDAVENAVGYKIYRSDAKNGTYSLILSIAGTSFTNTSVTAGQTYYYYVKTVSEDGTLSDASNIVGRTCDLSRPEVTVSNVKSTGKIQISWEKVDGAVKYELHRATSKEGPYTRLTTISGTSVTNNSTTAGKTYYYKVKAIAEDSAANSVFSSVKSRTCDLARPEISVSNDPNTGKIQISWDKVKGAEKYAVYRATSKNGTYTRLTTIPGTSVTNNSTTAGKTYYYKVKAIAENTAANSAESAVKQRTCNLARPVADVSLNSNGKPVVDWGPVKGAVKYRLYIYDTDGDLVKTATTTKTEQPHGSAVKGKTYSYRVLAIASNSAANSYKSVTVSIKSK